MKTALLSTTAALALLFAVPAMAQDQQAGAAAQAPADAQSGASSSQMTPPASSPSAPSAAQAGAPASAMSRDPSAPLGSAANPMPKDSPTPADQAHTLTAGDPTVVSNAPIPDTKENRAKFGHPLSAAGRATKPAGN